MLKVRSKLFAFPIKTPYTIVGFIIWNGLFLYDLLPFFINKNQDIPRLGAGMFIALILLFSTTVLLLVSRRFRTLVLKENQEWNAT